MLFYYKAKNDKGEIKNAYLESNDKTAALASLKAQNLYVIKIEKKDKNNDILALFHRKVPLKEKIIFTKQLAIMIRSGLSIIEALKSIREESSNKLFQSIVLNLVSEVEGGTPLSEALAHHKETFGDIYVSMVKSGEKTGKVDSVLERLAKQLENDFDLQRKIKGALSYPIFILITMVIVVSIVIVYVIPQLRTIFDDAGVSLPATTNAMINISIFLRNYGIYTIIAIVLLYIALSRWHKTNSGRHFFDKMVISIPIIGGLMRKAYMARFTRTFAALTGAGLPLLDVFKSSGKVIGNILYEEEIIKMSRHVEDGELISAVFKRSKLFPNMVGQLSAVGEKSGSVDGVFDSMADFYDREVEAITSNLSSLLEPILMVVIGTGIGFVVISILQPIYSLVNAI
jgi:type IV pilus assembly protein PilC